MTTRSETITTNTDSPDPSAVPAGRTWLRGRLRGRTMRAGAVALVLPRLRCGWSGVRLLSGGQEVQGGGESPGSRLRLRRTTVSRSLPLGLGEPRQSLQFPNPLHNREP